MKTRLVLTTIAVIALLQACAPINQPAPRNLPVSGNYDVNILDFGDSINYQASGKTKLIPIEGDTLCFDLVKGNEYINFMIWVKSASNIQYEYLNYDSLQIDSTKFTLLKKDEHILHLSNARWKPFLYAPGMTIFDMRHDSALIGYDTFSIIGDASIASPSLLFGLSNYQNMEGFLVFRRKYNDTYLYFWLRIKAEPNTTFQLGSLQYNGGYSINVLDGKYQQDSIITGQ